MEREFTSGDDYCDAMIQELVEATGAYGDLLQYWEKELRVVCNRNYYNYITGELEDYKLTETEVTDCYNTAMRKMISDALDGLHEKGVVTLGVDSEGEIVYSLTEKGKEYVENELKEPGDRG